MTRLAPILLAVAAAATLLGVPPARSTPALVPVHPAAPADGAMIAGNGNPLEVKLAWSIPRQPVPVLFFVEVVALKKGAVREVFAGYVDRSTVEVKLDGRTGEYAWRVYTIGRSVAEYALSGWQRFSVRVTK